MGGGGSIQLVGAITFTKDGIITPCTIEMNILWYNLSPVLLHFHPKQNIAMVHK